MNIATHPFILGLGDSFNLAWQRPHNIAGWPESISFRWLYTRLNRV